MAHGRNGPDVVMNTRYAGVSEIRAATEHEKNRTPDGSSAIDPARTHLNRVFVGPATQQEALQELWASGVRRPAKQAEDPYVQMVLSVSAEYFRSEGRGPGEWDQERLDQWVEATLKWLRETYGEDLVHVSLHLDEDTPHFHALIAPTYEKKPRMPGRKKRNETEEDFEARKAAVTAAETVRTAGRSSNPYWSRIWARRDARKSYHSAVEHLGLGYGRDFVAESEPSPKHKPTGKWVREEAARLHAEAERLSDEGVQLSAQAKLVAERERKAQDRLAALDVREADLGARTELILKREIEEERAGIQLQLREGAVAEQEQIISKVWQRIHKVLNAVGKVLGITPFNHLSRDLGAIEEAVAAMSATPEEPCEETDGPGF
jgi:hypothetical protein